MSDWLAGSIPVTVEEGFWQQLANAERAPSLAHLLLLVFLAGSKGSVRLAAKAARLGGFDNFGWEASSAISFPPATRSRDPQSIWARQEHRGFTMPPDQRPHDSLQASSAHSDLDGPRTHLPCRRSWSDSLLLVQPGHPHSRRRASPRRPSRLREVIRP